MNEQHAIADTLTLPVDPVSGETIPTQPSPHTCPWWVQYMLLNPVRRLLERPRKLLAPLVRPGMVVAEPGCGFGAFSLDIAEMVGPDGKVLCVDIEPRAIEKLEKRARSRGMSERIVASSCEPERLGLEGWSGRVELVLLAHVLHEVPDQAGLLAQIVDLLVPGGKLLLTEPPGSHITDQQYRWELARCRAMGLRQLELPGGPQTRRALFTKDAA